MDSGRLREALRDSIHNALMGELSDVYDCTRVWSAWGYGTMDEHDFKPVLNRIDDIIDTITAEIEKSPAHFDTVGATMFFDGYKSGEREGFYKGYDRGFADTDRNPATAIKEILGPPRDPSTR